MIDEVKDRAVIIDLGISTDLTYYQNETTIGDKNRRYGGENDLQSLGQIMYKMATGKHLFNSSINISTHLVPDKIKAEREFIYTNGSLLESRLNQVGERITDKTLAEIIRICLTAKGSDEDYKLIRQRFNEYRD